nr:adhesion G-protein coupled receptor G2 isoform X2 [Scatophagus argus]
MPGLYSCMVILEMSGPVDSCSLNKLLQQLIDSSAGITNIWRLARMVVCGPPGLPVRYFNLTWVAKGLVMSDVCQPKPTLFECGKKEMLAVLLTDNCPPTSPQSTTQTKTNVTASPENSSTKLQNTTPAHQNTPELSSVNSTQQTTTAALIDSTSNTATLSPNYTTVYNVTTVDNKKYSTITTSNTTINTFTPSPKHTAEDKITTVTPPPNGTTQYSVTTASSHGKQHNSTITATNTTFSTFTPSLNHTVVNNVTTVTSGPDRAEYSVKSFTTAPNHTNPNSVSTATNNHTTAFNNYTSHYNLTTVTPSSNDATDYNVTTVKIFTTSPNRTMANRVTTATDTYATASNNYTEEYNKSTVGSNRNLHNSTINTTIKTFTQSPNHTVVDNVTITAINYTTASNSDTTEYNATAVEALTISSNHTIVYNVTAASKNYTTALNNDTAEYSITTADNNRKHHNSSVTTNMTVSTAVYSVATTTNNYTTASDNDTTVHTVTTSFNNDNLHNSTINATTSTFTSSSTSNYTVVHTVTTVSDNYTAAESITTITGSQNKTATHSVTTSPITETQKNSTTPYTTVSTKNSTVDKMTPVVKDTAKPTAAPLNNQTGNPTTEGVTHNITADNKNDSNSTVTATGISPIINSNETAGISLNLSSIASSLTPDFIPTTKGPGVNLTTTFPNHSAEYIAVTSTTNGPLSVQINTTTAEVSLTSTVTLQATTLASTSTVKFGIGTTSTSTAETTKTQEVQEEQANELLDQTLDASQLNFSQVAQLAGQLEKLLDGPTVSQAVGQKAINIISNLMEGDSLALSASANRLIRVVDDLGLKLIVVGDSEIVSSNSLVLAVRTVNGTNFPTMSVDIFNTDNVQLHALSRSRSKRSGSALGSVFLPSSLTMGLSPEQLQQATRVQFTFYSKSTLFQDSALNNQTLVSPVLGSSVTNLSISNLSENIQFTIRNINPVHTNYTTSCVFWDFTLNGGGGGWSSAGCFLVNATLEGTTCSCNHLTSFAVLLDLSREGITDRQDAQILTFITYIGCGISAVFLTVTLLTYLSFEKLRRDIPAKILVQLCVSLLLLNLVFLLDGWLALYPAIGLCISTAFFLHYFLLTSFTWAGLEALHMYLSVVQVFTPYLSRYMLKFSLIGWGIPLVVVIVVISVDKDNYGLVTYGKYKDGTSDDFCWLRNDIAFYVGVVAYYILVFALCLLVFIMVMVQLARIKKQNPQNQSPNRGVLTDLRSIAGLIILLGLTWGFALFAWGPLTLPFIYLFSIFNTLQGFLVFVFHCAVKENVRRQWRTHLCCGRLRLAENSEWSRTATQNNRIMSVGPTTTSATHLTSRSCSVISDGTSSSDSVFVDSGISDGFSADVVLNEIHRQ